MIAFKIETVQTMAVTHRGHRLHFTLAKDH